MSGDNKTIWTAEMLAVLKASTGGRATATEIAAKLGVPEDAVRSKLGKMGLKHTSRVSEPLRARILDLASQGWRPSRIARQLRLDPAVVELNLAGSSPASRAPSDASLP